MKSYVAWLLILEAACMGTFLALDLFVFFVFFEVVLVPMYFLIANWGHGRRDYAAMKFFLYTLAGSAFLLVAMLALVFLHARGDNALTFDLITLAKDPGVSGATARWLFLGFAVAFAVKVPLFPLHTWLPDAHTEAPTAGSVILAGILLKMGTYGLLRFCLELFPKASVDLAPLMVTLAVIGIIYGAIVAAVQKDMKRLVAYSSVAHLGFIVLGTFAFTSQGHVRWRHPDDQPRRIHRRAVPSRRHDLRAPPHPRHLRTERTAESRAGHGGGVHRRDAELDRLAGSQRIRRRVPRPHRQLRSAPLVGGRRHDSASCSPPSTCSGCTSVSSTACPRATTRSMLDLNLREKLVLAPLLLLIVGMGVYPKPVLDRINPSVDQLIHHVRVASDGGAK